jgi:hypothetical protein
MEEFENTSAWKNNRIDASVFSTICRPGPGLPAPMERR